MCKTVGKAFLKVGFPTINITLKECKTPHQVVTQQPEEKARGSRLQLCSSSRSAPTPSGAHRKSLLQEESSRAIRSLTLSRAISLTDLFLNQVGALCIFYDPRWVTQDKIKFTLLYVKIMNISILLVVSKRTSYF